MKLPIVVRFQDFLKLVSDIVTTQFGKDFLFFHMEEDNKRMDWLKYINISYIKN